MLIKPKCVAQSWLCFSPKRSHLTIEDQQLIFCISQEKNVHFLCGDKKKREIDIMSIEGIAIGRFFGQLYEK